MPTKQKATRHGYTHMLRCTHTLIWDVYECNTGVVLKFSGTRTHYVIIYNSYLAYIAYIPKACTPSRKAPLKLN